MTILGIESSCDETSAAILDDQGLKSNIIASQTVHEKFGGVVPELASRAHHKTISLTVNQALDESGAELDQVDAIAVTQGPGLMGSLLVGLCFAKGLALKTGKPLIGINHMEAHIYANFIEHNPGYPFVALTVSGGHTQLVHVTAPFEHRLMGQTRDDAAGEAFDKIGKILGLPYPAGPVMDEKAQKGDPHFHDFPQAMLNKGFEFSFSGLKTSVLYYLEEQKEKKGEQFVDKHLENICASVSHAITEVLIKKLVKAVHETGVDTVLIAGGVSANTMLRAKAKTMAEKHDLKLFIPRLEYCTDNAAMIAQTGYMKAKRQEFDSMELKPFANMKELKKMK